MLQNTLVFDSARAPVARGSIVILLLLSDLFLSACTGPLTRGAGEDGLPAACAGGRFSFAVFSDNYGGQEGGLKRILQDARERDPDIRFLVSAGDTPSYQRVRGILDEQLNSRVPCGADGFPWFPAAGNHDVEVQSYMDWWASNWADRWETDPAQSRLARQMPGLTNFRRGPLQVQRQDGTMVPVDAGTIYSFDYLNAHFVFINNYEQDIISDPAAGVWDHNGAHFDPGSSQLDWLREDLQLNSRPLVFVFGHVALLAPCYNREPPNPNFPCPGLQPPGWSEHNSQFHTTGFTRLLAEHNVLAYFHGHDHVPSRMLVNMDRTAAYQRLYWDVHNDPAGPRGDTAGWADLQGPGRVWQVDAGLVYTRLGTYVLVKLDESAVTFEIYRYQGGAQEPVVLWDTWTVPVQAYCGAPGCGVTQMKP